MNQFLRLCTLGALLLASHAHAQVTMRTNSLSLLNGSHELLLVYGGTGTATLTIPSSSSTTVLAGSSAGQTLRWDGTQWTSASNVLNDGTDITLPSANLTLTAGILTGNGSGLTNLDASDISSGALNIARISTSGAVANEVLMYDGTNLVWDLPPSEELTLPFLQEDNSASTLLALTNFGLGSAISGQSSSYGLHGIGSTGVMGEGNETGVNGFSSTGDGVLGASESGHGISGLSEDGIAGFFQIAVVGNNSNVVEAWTANSGHALFGSSVAGRGVHGTSTSSDGVYGVSSSGNGITGTSSTGTGGSFSGSPAVHIQSGALVGSVASVNDNGTVPANAVVVIINNNGNPDPCRVSSPATGQQGQILIVCCLDPQGAIIDESYGLDPYQNHVLVYIDGGWLPPSGSS